MKSPFIPPEFMLVQEDAQYNLLQQLNYNNIALMIIIFIYKNMQSTPFPLENNLHSIYLYLLKFCVFCLDTTGEM